MFFKFIKHVIRELAHITRYYGPYLETSEWSFDFKIFLKYGGKSSYFDGTILILFCFFLLSRLFLVYIAAANYFNYLYRLLQIDFALFKWFQVVLHGFSSFQVMLACFRSFQIVLVVPHFSKYLLGLTNKYLNHCIKNIG